MDLTSAKPSASHPETKGARHAHQPVDLTPAKPPASHSQAKGARHAHQPVDLTYLIALIIVHSSASPIVGPGESERQR